MKYLILFCALLVSYASQAQTKPAPPRYELKGIVTYYFNDNYGYKSDVGAKAYILKEATVKAGKIEVSKLEQYLASPPDARNPTTLLPGEFDVKTIEADAQTAKFRIMTDPAASIVTADGSGVFTKKLAPGTYFVLINSANRDRVNLVESLGQSQLRKVVVKDDDIEVSAKFNP
ncbi:hypothetical protein [Hymenobacter tenuis]